MQILRRTVAVSSALALAATGALAAAGPSSAAQGNRSLAKVLTSDGNQFDRKAGDYDIVTEAVLAVLKDDPNSAVSLLTKGGQRATAFIPNDQAFRYLVYDLTGKWVAKERKVFSAVAGLGLPTVETVLLYHVAPGATVNAKKALASDGADLTTAQGGKISVDVLNPNTGKIRLQDQDPDDVDPVTKPGQLNINKGNKQIAHGIEFVLRPADL